MEVDKYNAEGYLDLTPYQAIRNVGRHPYYPLVYICSPYAGDHERNTEAAKAYSRFAVDNGCIPIAPHLLFPQFMEDEEEAERVLAMHFGNVLMDKCSEVWVFGERISEGMAAEIKRAKRKYYRIRYFTEDLKEVL